LDLDPILIQTAFEGLPQAVLLTDASLRVFGFNKQAQSLLGHVAGELRGKELVDILHADGKQRVAGLLAGSNGRQDGVHQITAKVLKASQASFTAELRCKLLRTEGGDLWLILISDVTAQQEAVGALRENEERYRRMVEASPDGVALLDKGVLVFANGSMEHLLGLSGPDELWGSELESFVHPDDLAVWQSLMQSTRSGSLAQAREVRMVRPGGKVAELEFTGLNLGHEGTEIALVLARDIGQRKTMERRLRESEERYKGLADVAFDGLAVHLDGIILNVNRSFESIFRQPLGSLVGTNLYSLFTPDSAGQLKSGLDNGTVLELQGEKVQGQELFVEASTRACLFHGEPAYVTALRDVTRRRQTEDIVRRQAWYDALTGLPNRILFLDRLEHALDQAKREGRRISVLFLDLDRFKMVNDSLGHAAGDQLLQAAAGRLQGILRKSDTVARLGGDEFTVLLEDPVLVADAMGVSRKIVDSLRLPFMLGSQEVHIGASVGVAFYPDHAGDPERLLKLADMAMYRAKNNGRNQAAVYAEALEATQERRLGLENDLRRAIERGQFVLWYQPQVRISNGQIIGAEALLRWQHPTRGLLLPDEFIPLAEESRLIVPMGEWVVFEACRQAAFWKREAGISISVAVNLSAWQLHKRSLLKTVDTALAQSGLDPGLLELEITETVAMRDPARTLVMLRAFADRGVRLSLDDFGKGYSSLSYLKDFPVHTIKADQAFISGLPSQTKDVAIVRAVIALARSLGLTCLAEGIETQGQLDFLRAEGCDLGQGYLFARPMPAGEFHTLSTAHPCLTPKGD
jgi:diguanylate cyclase (GGDEF)-like protein/PAS domain S-box-containing protein